MDSLRRSNTITQLTTPILADDEVLKPNNSGLANNRSSIDLTTINRPNMSPSRRFKKQFIPKEEVEHVKPVRILKNAMKGNNLYKSNSKKNVCISQLNRGNKKSNSKNVSLDGHLSPTTSTKQLADPA